MKIIVLVPDYPDIDSNVTMFRQKSKPWSWCQRLTLWTHVRKGEFYRKETEPENPKWLQKVGRFTRVSRVFPLKQILNNSLEQREPTTFVP